MEKLYNKLKSSYILGLRLSIHNFKPRKLHITKRFGVVHNFSIIAATGSCAHNRQINIRGKEEEDVDERGLQRIK